MSEGAAWLTLAALAPPEERKQPRLVWKTGTSWNQLDGWAVAMTPELVVGVWCGRLGRGGSDWVAGGRDALPLALEVLDAVSMYAGEKSGGKEWPKPGGVEFRQVCAETGSLPGWQCEETLVSPVLVGNYARQFCRGHAIPATMPEPRRQDMASLQTLRILSPANGGTYVRTAGASLPLQAQGARGDLTWFLNGNLIGKTGDVLEWPLRAGRHRLSVTDGNSENAAVEFMVEETRRETRFNSTH